MKDIIVLEMSSVLALALTGKLEIDGETVTIPEFETFKNNLITVDRAADKECRWTHEGLVTYGVVHEMRDGTKIVVDFMDACNLYPGKLGIMSSCD